MTCKSRRSGAACLRNGMRMGWWLQQQVLGEREREGGSHPGCSQSKWEPIQFPVIPSRLRPGRQDIRERWEDRPLTPPVSLQCVLSTHTPQHVLARFFFFPFHHHCSLKSPHDGRSEMRRLGDGCVELKLLLGGCVFANAAGLTCWSLVWKHFTLATMNSFVDVERRLNYLTVLRFNFSDWFQELFVV